MRLGVVGSRSWTNRELFWKHLCAWHRQHPDLHVVSGGAANGADNLAEQWCRQKGVSITVHFARWTRPDGTKDLGAGFARNGTIAGDSESRLAFWDGKTPGTASTVAMAIKRGIPVWIVLPDGTIKNQSA